MLFAPAALALIFCSCYSIAPDTTDKSPDPSDNFSKAAYALANLQKYQDYWGKISASSPEWIPDTNQFKINFSEDVTNYAAAARTNVAGGQASSLETSLFLGQMLQGSVTPPVSTGSAATNGGGSNATLQLPNQAEGAISNFAPVQTLGNLSPVPDEREVVNKAINDKIAESLMELMACPTLVTNQVLLFGVMQITCQPGQRTRKGFMAELDVSLSYGQDTADDSSVNRNHDYFPNVLSVLPLVDNENVQLQRSDRSQIELAAALSAAFAAKGLNAAATSLADYVKRQQSDVDTRNTVPIATTYASGSTFGFQIYPSLQAIENPGKGDSKAGTILQPITFPAVVAIAIDKADIEGMKGTKGNDGSTKPWNYIVADNRTRWVRMKRPFTYAIPFFGSAPILDRISPSHASLYHDLWEAKQMDMVKSRLKILETNEYSSAYGGEYLTLQATFETLKDAFPTVWTASAALSDDLFKKPDGNKPVISDVFPHSIWRNQNTTFTLLGSNLDGCTEVFVSGLQCSAPQVSQISIPGKKAGDKPVISQIISTTLTVNDAFRYMTNTTNSVDFVACTPHGSATKTIVLPLQGEISSDDAVVTISRDTNTSKVTGFEIKNGEKLKEDALLNALQSILQKSEPPPKTIITKP